MSVAWPEQWPSVRPVDIFTVRTLSQPIQDDDGGVTWAIWSLDELQRPGRRTLFAEAQVSVDRRLLMVTAGIRVAVDASRFEKSVEATNELGWYFNDLLWRYCAQIMQSLAGPLGLAGEIPEEAPDPEVFALGTNDLEGEANGPR